VCRFVLKTEHLPRQARDKHIGKVGKRSDISAGVVAYVLRNYDGQRGAALARSLEGCYGVFMFF
jgi:hypothetical protein